ncbi:MAG: hypothetical protein AAB923_02055 [Patescibacteria group bacterium]
MKNILTIIGVAAAAVIIGWAVWYFFLRAAPSGPGTGGEIPTPLPGEVTPGAGGQQGETEVPGSLPPATPESPSWFESWFGGLSKYTTESKQEPPTTAPTPQAQKAAVAEVLQRYISDISKTITTIGGAIVVSNFALQEWGDENAGGMALLRYSLESGWIVVDMGGGAPAVEWLVSLGVPQATAEKLVADGTN